MASSLSAELGVNFRHMIVSNCSEMVKYEILVCVTFVHVFESSVHNFVVYIGWKPKRENWERKEKTAMITLSDTLYINYIY